MKSWAPWILAGAALLATLVALDWCGTFYVWPFVPVFAPGSCTKSRFPLH